MTKAKAGKMTVADAAKIWRELHARQRELKTAAEVLKEHFRRTGRATYRNLIGYSKTTFMALDTERARQELGAKVRDCEVERTRETLSVGAGETQ